MAYFFKDESNKTICSPLYAAAQVMSINGEMSERLCKICAEICQVCGDECARHKEMHHCRECAEVCYACAQECRAMAGVAA